MRKLTVLTTCSVFAAAFFLNAAPAASQDLCPYDVSGDYTYDAARTPTYLFFGDGQITYDGSIVWYLDDVMSCYNTYQTPGYGIYFPKCDLDGNGSVSISEVYDVYYRIHPVNQTDKIAQTACSEAFNDAFFFCHPSRYNRTVSDINAIVADLPATAAIREPGSGGEGNTTAGYVYNKLTCSTPGIFPPGTFDVPNACYKGVSDCAGACPTVNIDFPDSTNIVLTAAEYNAAAQNYGGSCSFVPTAYSTNAPGFHYFKVDSNVWQWTVRTTAQCSGSGCACDMNYSLRTDNNVPGVVTVLSETNNSTAACTDVRFGGTPQQGDCSGANVAELGSLCWEKDNTTTGEMNFADAQTYCANLALDGYDDWRMPTIDELRMIISSSCPTQTYGGGCGLTDPTCLNSTCDDTCSPCAFSNYLASPLLGNIDYATFSSSMNGANHWSVRYGNAFIYTRGAASANAVRCVRESTGTPCTDTDGDGVCDSSDGCPSDPGKIDPGACGCGTADVDANGNGTADCLEPCWPELDSDDDGVCDPSDACPTDPNKSAPGACGCHVADIDTDGDGAYDCNETCDNDPNKTSPGVCGCGIADDDTDGDGALDCQEICDSDPNKTDPGVCGCNVDEFDTDGDGTPDCIDVCPTDPTNSCQDPCYPYGDTDGDGVCDNVDGCPTDPNKANPGQCGCSVADTDSDGDGVANCNDGCDFDANKTAPGLCGCGTADTDSDGDGTPNCTDGCDFDANKTAPGVCGCGTPDVDTDSDGILDCNDSCPNDPTNTCQEPCYPYGDTDGDGICDNVDGCPSDPNKSAPGQCGCGTADTDSDSDGVANCNESCDYDPNKTAPGACGCGNPDIDNDGDGVHTCQGDQCDNDPNKTTPGTCGCGNPDTDSDGDGTPDCNDLCDNDPNKTVPGTCGCGTADTDTDGDGTADCNDLCDTDPNKTSPGTCGCGIADTDTDGDGVANCNETCDTDPNKTQPGICGCGVADDDSDGDGAYDCNENCDNDPNKTQPGACGCGTADTDSDSDGTANCNEQCDYDPNKTVPGVCGCGTADIDNDGDNVYTCEGDQCDNDPAKTLPGQCGCGTADTDTDGDGTADCNDGCYTDPNKTAPGTCGCGTADVDSDGDGSLDCQESCDYDANKTQPGVCGCGTADIDNDGDGIYTCQGDNCDNDPAKTSPGQCGCGNPDTDTDGDGAADCVDPCPNDNPDDPDGDGQCGWAAASPTCDNLAGTDWGSCPPSPLGAAVINGTCQMIFGCQVPGGIALWSNVPECQQNCEGCVDNSTCTVDEYCEFPAVTQCGTLGFGSCVPRAEVCAQIYDPVCSCTERTHSSACHASLAGETVDYPGECICTSDPDGDGICDPHDTCPNDPDNDIDYDGICGDVDPCPNDPDNDEDGDGMCGDVDPCPTDPNPGCQPDPCAGIGDADGDGVCDDVDNCVNDSNPGQEDTDGDGIGDACETCTGGTPTLHSWDVGGPNTFGEPGDFAELDGLLYFRARVEGYGEELMAYDPVADDTFLVADIYPGDVGGNPSYMIAHDGKLYFRARDINFDTELHVYDPVADQVDKIDVDPVGSSNPKDLYSASDGLVYFNAREANDIELYTYNPTNDQLTRYEIFPGNNQYGSPNQGTPKEFLEYNGVIYMQADSPEGKELHGFNMTSKQIQRLTNIASGYSNGLGLSSYPTELAAFNNEIFFNAAKDAALDQELWIYTPATGGVREIEIDPGQTFFQGGLTAAGSSPSKMTPYNGKLYMRAQQRWVGIELFVYDPVTDGVTLVWDSAPGTYQQCYATCLTFGNDGNTAHLTLLNDVFYFVAPFDNRELWYYDPAIDDGGQLMEIFPGVDQWGNPNHADPNGITVFNDSLFFRGNDPNYDMELFSVSWDCP